MLPIAMLCLQTLSDEDRRAMYDALSGFSTTSVNPFLDTTFERDQVRTRIIHAA